MKKLMIILVALFTVTTVASAQDVPTFTPMGVTDIGITDMTPDGSVMVGLDLWTFQQIIWTPEGGIQNIGGYCYGGSPAISNDGTFISGNAIDDYGFANAAYWLGGMDWYDLGGYGEPCSDEYSSAYDVSGDGSIIVGLGWNTCSEAHAFRWEESTGVVDLGSSVPGQNSRANAISDDGNVIVGWQEMEDGYWQGAYWIDGVQTTLYDSETGNPVYAAQGVNHDGSVIVGGPGAGELWDEAWRWTPEGGVEALGAIVGGWFPLVYATDTSDDGSVIIGFATEDWDRYAVIWTEELGTTVKLYDYLMDLGTTGLEGWWLSEASVISSDGTTIAGYGINPDFLYEPFIVTLPGQKVASLDITADEDPVVVPRGGSFGYTGVLTNNTDQPMTIDTWIMGVGPEGNTFGPLREWSDLAIEPYGNITAHLNQYVRPRAPLGVYTFIAYCGEYGASVTDSSFFSVEVIEGNGIVNRDNGWLLEGTFE